MGKESRFRLLPVSKGSIFGLVDSGGWEFQTMDTRQEITLSTVRVHWGVFMPAILVLLIMTVIGAVNALVFHFIGHAFNTLSQSLGQPLDASSPTSHFPVLLLWMMIFMLAVPVIFLFLAAWLYYTKSEVTLTNRRLIFRMGIFYARMSGELPLENIETIFIFESVLGRLFGWGTVNVTTVGGSHFPMRYIGSPQHFHEDLQQAVTDAKKSGGPFRISSETKTPVQDDESRYMPKR